MIFYHNFPRRKVVGQFNFPAVLLCPSGIWVTQRQTRRQGDMVCPWFYGCEARKVSNSRKRACTVLVLAEAASRARLK